VVKDDGFGHVQFCRFEQCVSSHLGLSTLDYLPQIDAIVQDEFGGPETFKQEKIDMPHLNESEFGSYSLIKVTHR